MRLKFRICFRWISSSFIAVGFKVWVVYWEFVGACGVFFMVFYHFSLPIIFTSTYSCHRCHYLCQHNTPQWFIGLGIIYQCWQICYIYIYLYSLYIFYTVSLVPADGLAPLGARPSAGTVMTNWNPDMAKIDRRTWSYYCDPCQQPVVFMMLVLFMMSYSAWK